jgi:hypothetical protein
MPTPFHYIYHRVQSCDITLQLIGLIHSSYSISTTSKCTLWSSLPPTSGTPPPPFQWIEYVVSFVFKFIKIVFWRHLTKIF